MTSLELKDYIQTYRVLDALENEVESNEIYRAANFAQKEILRQCELLEDFENAQFNHGQYIYTVNNWNFLKRVIRIKSIKIINQNEFVIYPKSREYCEEQRYINSTYRGTNPPPMFLYHLNTNPKSVGIYGTPTSDDAVICTIVRGHCSDDNINDNTNPIIPDDYDELLVQGTLAKLLEYRSTFSDDKLKFTKLLGMIKPSYEALKNEARIAMNLKTGFSMTLNRLKM